MVKKRLLLSSLQVLLLTAGLSYQVSANPVASTGANTATNKQTTTCSEAALQGGWELQSAVYRDSSGKVVGEIKNQQTKSRKLIAGSYFSFITWQADGKFEVAASGRFSTPGGAYHETPDSSSLARLLHKTYQFQCQLSGNLWLHSGDEDGIQIEEVWQRLAAPEGSEG